MWKMKTAELTEDQFDERDAIMSKYRRMEAPFNGSFCGGVCYYTDLDLKTLELLVEKGYADPEERQNSAPSIGEIMDVMRRNPGLTAHGYYVTRERDDARISVEGVAGIIDPNDLGIFRGADEFDYDGKDFYCWFD